MVRYIDADKLYAEMEDLYEHHIEMRNFSADGAVADCLDILAKQPTADVVEVVRCKDCKHYDGQKCKEIYYVMDGYYGGSFEVKKPTDFCSNGERRTDDDL